MYYLCHYLRPSGCVSNLKVPNFQLWLVDVFSIFNAIALALARVSTFCVEELISKGPNAEPDWVSLGKFLNCNVTLVLPVCYIKSGINLLIFIINSPSPLKVATPVACPVADALACVISKSPEDMFAVIGVVVPPCTWSVPVSCW